MLNVRRRRIATSSSSCSCDSLLLLLSWRGWRRRLGILLPRHLFAARQGRPLKGQLSVISRSCRSCSALRLLDHFERFLLLTLTHHHAEILLALLTALLRLSSSSAAHVGLVHRRGQLVVRPLLLAAGMVVVVAAFEVVVHGEAERGHVLKCCLTTWISATC